MKAKIAINGFGRIGRSIFRTLFEQPDVHLFEIVAINELAKPEHVLHLLQYDSVHGTFKHPVKLSKKGKRHFLEIAGQRILLLQQEDSLKLPWKSLKVDLVMECTGKHGSYHPAYQHIESGAKKVLISQPGNDQLDNTVVFGVNEKTITSEQEVISNASCTSNCLFPILKIIDDHSGIKRGTSTTIHAAMADQPVNDSYARQLHLSRSAMQSIIPTPTDLASGVGKFFPSLAGKFETLALRVPTLNVSLMDVTLQLKKDCSIEAINKQLSLAAKKTFKGIVNVSELPLVSIDYNQNPHSVTVDLKQTRMVNRRLLKLMLWFDNEWGFANRMLDTASIICKS